MIKSVQESVRDTELDRLKSEVSRLGRMYERERERCEQLETENRHLRKENGFVKRVAQEHWQRLQDVANRHAPKSESRMNFDQIPTG